MAERRPATWIGLMGAKSSEAGVDMIGLLNRVRKLTRSAGGKSLRNPYNTLRFDDRPDLLRIRTIQPCSRRHDPAPRRRGNSFNTEGSPNASHAGRARR